MDYVYILAPIGLGVILTLCSTGYCIYIHYSKRRLVERIKKEMLAKIINGPDAIVYNTHWRSNIKTGKTNSVVSCPKPPGRVVGIGGSQVDIYSHPIQSRTDVFVQKVGSEVFSSLTNERPQVLNVLYSDYKHTTHYGSPKTKNYTTSIPSHRAVESDGIYVNCPFKPSQKPESSKHYNMRYQ
uniref:Uncharacterized protein n=1 Tax=Schistosoma haematobium TaxID=6185 RepID=A0A094ZDC8_SCHHA